MNILKIVLVVLAILSVPLSAKEYKSGVIQMNTIELFSSEGCSSCPPADEWISDYVHNDEVFKKVIPMVFHVPYWDYIGWKDPFAMIYSETRQREYESEKRSKFVYTPQFIVNSKEWKGWFNTLLDREWKASTKKVGVLEIKYNEVSNQVNIKFSPISKISKKYRLHIAVLGMGISSSIKRGENANRELLHDFVVLNHKQYKTQQNGQWSVKMLEIPSKNQKRNAIVAWISSEDSQKITQSTGGYL